LTSVRYPNGRRVHYIADDLSRVDAISDGDTTVYASYAYNGAGRMVVEDFEEPDVRLDYWGQTADTYAGFDRFGRVVRQLWRDYGASADRDSYGYGYDRNSNRTWKDNDVSAAKDEVYVYDHLKRLRSYGRGDRSGGGVANKSRGEEWATLSPT